MVPSGAHGSSKSLDLDDEAPTIAGMESNITICWKHVVPSSDIQAALKRIATELSIKYGAQSVYKGNAIFFRCDTGVAAGISGVIETSPGIIRMRVDLPFLYRAASGTIREGIEAGLAREVKGARC